MAPDMVEPVTSGLQLNSPLGQGVVLDHVPWWAHAQTLSFLYHFTSPVPLLAPCDHHKKQ